jgi:hypothetical protein
VKLDDFLEIFGVLSAGRVFTVERKCGRGISGDGVAVAAAEAVAGNDGVMRRISSGHCWNDASTSPRSDGVGVETQIREYGPKTDVCGTYPDNRYVERRTNSRNWSTTEASHSPSVNRRES